MLRIGLLCLGGATAAFLTGCRYPRTRRITSVAALVLGISVVVLCSIWYPGC